MESQQLSVMNIAGRPKADTNKTPERASNEVAGSSAKTRFDEQLNQQVEQLQAPDGVEKPDKIQIVGEESVETAEVSGVPHANQQNTDLPGNTGQNEGMPLPGPAQIDIPLLTDPLQNLPEVADTLAAAISVTGLPQAGKNLPLSGEVTQSLASDNKGSRTNIAVTAAPQAQLLQERQMTEAKAVNQPTTAALVPESSEVISKAGLQLRPLMTQSTQIHNQLQAQMSSEASISEVISQASRMQQVAQTVQASATQFMTNTHAVPVTNAEAPIAPASGFNTTGLTSVLNSSISVPVNNAQWSNQLADQVIMMAKGGHYQAEIKLNPVHLGPMEIKLAVSDDQASVNFVSQHSAVREVIDNALPRLKEMLEQQGLNLAEADVSSHSENQAEHETEEFASSNTSQQQQDNDVVTEKEVISVSEVSDSGVNLYA